MPTKKCKKCGNRKRKFEGLLFHDLRRSAVTNLRRLGVAETDAMRTSGHLTASVFRRYDIQSTIDSDRVAERLDEKKQKSGLENFVSVGSSSGRDGQGSTTSDAVIDHRQIVIDLPN